jgi:hypothetical protein
MRVSLGRQVINVGSGSARSRVVINLQVKLRGHGQAHREDGVGVASVSFRNGRIVDPHAILYRQYDPGCSGFQETIRRFVSERIRSDEIQIGV